MIAIEVAAGHGHAQRSRYEGQKCWAIALTMVRRCVTLRHRRIPLRPHSSVAQWQSIRLLTEGFPVRVRAEEPTKPNKNQHKHCISALSAKSLDCPA